MYRVVDLGTKKAGALDEFRRNGHIRYGELAEAVPASRCLGVDRNHLLADFVRGKGYEFKTVDLTGPELSSLPEAEFYLAWDLLEHMPSVEHSQAVLRVMLERATVGVWLRLPAFEVKDVARLAQHGFRFTWTTWKCHPTPFKVKDATDVLDEMEAKGVRYDVRIRENLRIESSQHRSIVPVSAPGETIYYFPDLGKKKTVAFDPPIPGQWDIVCRRVATAAA